MISSQDIQNSYIKMYSQLRNYIWPAETIEHLAELEVSVFSAFNSMKDVRKCFYELDKDIKDTYKDDEDLKTSVSNFRKLIESNEDTYLRLYKVTEVLEQ